MIYALLIPISFLTIGVGIGLSEAILFPEKYPVWGCGVIDSPARCGMRSFSEVIADSSDSFKKSAIEGRTLFEANCASCHAVNSVVIGPALKDIEKRHSRKWLYKFIRNPEKVITSGDRYAIKLAKEYKDAGVMSAFSILSKQEIDAIMDYCSTGSY